MNDGRALESLTTEVFRLLTASQQAIGAASVEESVMLDGVDGPRQIDVLIRSSVGPIPLLTIVECKDYRKRVSVTVVDALHSVLQDVGASKGVLVTRGGYSGGALKKARRLGISLLRADELSHVKDEVVAVPILVRELRPTGLVGNSQMRLVGGQTMTTEALFVVNDVAIPALIRDDLIAHGEKFIEQGSGVHEWTLSDHMPPPWFVRDESGEPVAVEDASFEYVVEEELYFGYLHDTDAAIYLHDVLANDRTIVFRAEEFILMDYRETFAKFSDADALPAQPRLEAYVASFPDGPTVKFGPLWARRLSD